MAAAGVKKTLLDIKPKQDMGYNQGKKESKKYLQHLRGTVWRMGILCCKFLQMSCNIGMAHTLGKFQSICGYLLPVKVLKATFAKALKYPFLCAAEMQRGLLLLTSAGTVSGQSRLFSRVSLKYSQHSQTVQFLQAYLYLLGSQTKFAI